MGLLELLGLNLGNLNVSLTLDSRSMNSSLLHRRAPTVILPRDEAAAGLHKSVVLARDIVENAINVPTSELEDILDKLKDLENQVGDLLGEDDDSVEVTTSTENAQKMNGGEEEETGQDDAGSSDASNNIPGGAIFKEKVEVETEVLTSTMEDSTTTTTMTRTITKTVTKDSEAEPTVGSATEATSEPEAESSPESSPEPVAEPVLSSSDPTSPVTPPANVRIGGVFKEASNATAVQMNVAQPSKVEPSKIPGDLVSTPPTSMPVPAFKQFHQALYTNSSMSSGFQTVTLPGAQ